jgi:murein DD-endopeptidase MepM/ murein hydrolase activator NlpD
MPRLYFDAESGWWAFPLDGEAEHIVRIGEVERGPDNPPPPPWLPLELRELEQQAPDFVPDEPPAEYENAGAQVDEALRYGWFDVAEAYERGEFEPFGAGEFSPLEYEVAGACTVPGSHPPPGTLIGFPGTGTHSWTDPPNNWQSDNAVDIWLFPGTVVRACAAGVVSSRFGYGSTGQGGGSRFGGSRLHVEHPGGMVSFYMHMERLTARRGAHVRRGQALGRSGFGNCVPHLHFAVTQPRDPRAYAAFTYDRNAAPNPPPPAGEPPTPPPRVPLRGPGQAWHNLMHAIGPDRRNQKRRLRRARGSLKDALS